MAIRVPREFHGLIRGVFWVLVLAAILPTKADPDLWGNLRFGLDILQNWTFSTVDPYSFTQDVPWINHSWLPQIMTAAAYRAGDVPAIVFLKSILVATILWLIAGAFRGAAFLIPETAVAFVLLPAFSVFTVMRAQLWTILGVVVLCRMMLSRNPRTMVWAPVVFVIWVNSHVGWLIGLALLAWWAIGVLVRGPRTDRRWAVAIAIASLLATLLNPYGWQMWRFQIGVAHLSRDISEWQPLWAAPFRSQVAVTLSAVATVLLWRRLRFEQLASLAGLAYAAVRAIKFDTPFVIVTALFLSPSIVSRFDAAAEDAPTLPIAMQRMNRAVFTALLGVVVINASPRLSCLTSGEWRPDPVAAGALLAARPTGRIVVEFDWGEYIIWHLGPALKVSMDPRFDLVYSPSTAAEQTAVSNGTPEGIAFLERAQPEYVWFRQSSRRIKTWLGANGYRLDLDTPESFIAVRQDLAPLLAPGPRSFGCFPSP